MARARSGKHVRPAQGRARRFRFHLTRSAVDDREDGSPKRERESRPVGDDLAEVRVMLVLRRTAALGTNWSTNWRDVVRNPLGMQRIRRPALGLRNRGLWVRVPPGAPLQRARSYARGFFYGAPDPPPDPRCSEASASVGVRHKLASVPLARCSSLTTTSWRASAGSARTGSGTSSRGAR
jgi:hypothetical protein